MGHSKQSSKREVYSDTSEENENTNSKRYMHPMFIAALLTVAKIWRQPKCPSTDEWIKKICCVKYFTQ